MEKKDIKKILGEYDSKVTSIVNKVLTIEREFEYRKKLTTTDEKEIKDKIVKAIIEETKP